MGKSTQRKKQGERIDASSIEAQAAKVIDTKNKLNQYQKTISGIVTQDAFQNEMARIGFGSNNILEGTSYPLTRMSFNFNQFNAMYRGSWIARKIIDVVPSDMMKNWIKVTSEVEPDKMRKFDKTLKQTATKDKLLEGLRWGRLYGGAVGLIIIDREEHLEEPLNYDEVMPDSYKGLMIFDRWSGVYPSPEKITDIDSPEFGMPEFYEVTTQDAKSMKVHHSRIVRFNGRPLPYWEKMAEMQWGESELEVVFEELKKRDNTSYNIAYLIFLANIRVLKMQDLGTVMANENEQAKKELYNVLEAQNWLMSNMGMYVMDKEDDFSMQSASFGGLNDIYESFMLDVAGACEMPVTKLFGRAPAGFNSTGESDLVQYYETIETKQEEFLTPMLDKLLPIIAMSIWGAIPDDFDWEYNPVKVVNSKDLADLASSYIGNIVEVFNAGIVSKKTALLELKSQSEITGTWTNITDQDIEDASDDAGEDMDAMQNEIVSGMGKNNEDKPELNTPKGNIPEDNKDRPEVKSQPQEPTWRSKIASKLGLS
jgi:phage-related protein (TIGR01555 family)